MKRDEWEEKPEGQRKDLQWLRRMLLQKRNEAPQKAKNNRKLKLKTGYWLQFSLGAAVTGLHVSMDLTLK